MKPRQFPFGRAALALLVALGTLAAPLGYSVAHPAMAGAIAPAAARLNCANSTTLCPDVVNSDAYFGHYVGHDEPSLLFYSNQPGSGNRMAYYLKLPADPATPPPSGTDNFQLHPAFWFGMALCATASFPEQLTTCTPDSDTNIVDPARSPKHPGTAFLELQFYPPGWVPFQLPGGVSCDPTKWCAALVIWSFAVNPVTNTALNDTCNAKVGGPEYGNFAFVTHDGRAQAPANPVDATTATFTPDPTRDLFMSSGDQLSVALHDSLNGLQVVLQDHTSGQSGSMTASAANGFGQVLFAPNPSTACTNLPYNFHPMYSTSSEQTRVTWAAHSYNVAFSDEIGHFDYCSAVDPTAGTCTGTEGIPTDQEPSDADDTFCYPAAASLLVPVAGCTNSNLGFDGSSYQSDWPDGNTQLHPTPILVSSPKTGAWYTSNYQRAAFETDTLLIEAQAGTQGCNAFTAANCTIVPVSDDGTSAAFYPFYTQAQIGRNCVWTLGNDIPNLTTYDFGKTAQYGSPLPLSYTQGGGVQYQYSDFRQVLSVNPCVNP